MFIENRHGRSDPSPNQQVDDTSKLEISSELQSIVDNGVDAPETDWGHR